MLRTEKIHCPYCGEKLDITLDLSSGGQNYIEDCQVCCRPMEISLEIDVGSERVLLTVRRDDE